MKRVQRPMVSPRLSRAGLVFLTVTVLACSDDISLDDLDTPRGHDAGQSAAPDTNIEPDARPEGVNDLDASASDDVSNRHEHSDQGMQPEDTGTQPDTASETPDGPFRFWLAPDGDDSRTGLTESEAVATLDRAQDLVKSHGPTTDVEIYIKSGRYRGQSVLWDVVIPGKTITFTRTPDATDRPIFDGCLSDTNCPGGTLFRLRVSDGSATGLVFNYIRVENYQTALSFDGNRNSEGQSNGGNRVYGCYFYRIGNVFNPSVDPSTAVVRLVNSDDNVIENNHFHDVINTTQPNRIHAIYAAHMSDRNQIARNRFYNNSGDAVRLRDYSNDNTIVDNTFIKAGQFAGYTEWYCDHDARDDCTKTSPECPSWGNQFRRNALDGNYQCDALGTFEYFQGDSTTGCSAPSANARRLRTSDNTRTSTPCENHP